MNNKGFTLIELLGVIALLGIVSVIAIPSVVGITNLIKRNMLEKKAEIIEEAAIMLGQDMKGSIISSDKLYKNTYPCRSIPVSYLYPEYLDKDNDNECSKDGSSSCIVDPSNESKFLDSKEIIIYYKNKRILAVMDLDDTLSCS